MNKILRAKLYGESLKIHKVELSKQRLQQFNEVACELKEPLQNAILNIFFFQILNRKGIETLTDIIDCTFFGLINNKKSKVEMTLSGKKIGRFPADELFNSTRLFPLFSTQKYIIKTDKLDSGIYIVEREIGLVGTYYIELADFKPDLLKFYLSELKLQNNNYELLNFIYYDNKKIPISKSDVLLTARSTFIMK